ncbi:phosphatase PAP2 family protein [Arenimonas sp.]|nr:phosphatase PAP2 family protein [Candidatus Parcubacteria bacterium]
MSLFLVQLSIYITNAFAPEVLVLFCFFMLALSVLYFNIKEIKLKEALSVNCPNNVKGVIVISLSVFIAGILSAVLKFIFKIQRPENMLVLENGYSFPSGHASVIFAFCFAALFILFRYFKNHNNVYITYLHAILFVLTALLVSLTRVILQVHRPVDLIAGFIVGIASTYAAIKMYYTITKYVDFKIFK